MSEALYDIPLQKIDGTKANLGEHKGNVLLVVNVASKCGLTPQYAALEKLHERLSHEVLVVDNQHTVLQLSLLSCRTSVVTGRAVGNRSVNWAPPSGRFSALRLPP